MGVYYSIQTYEAWREAQINGYFIGNEKFVWDEFKTPYRWLIDQMNELIEHDGTYPLWLWLEKPDLSEEALLEKGTEAVCLTLSVPDHRVLISDFNAWHCVLSNFYCCLTDEEDDQIDQGVFKLSMEESWKRIFDIDLLSQSEYWTTEEPLLQGVTGKIFLHQVISFEFFKAN
ncbi:DUF3841 domain-containing protein [Paenibacillus radicis (ex Xue et al. 2023)]|uniref:DUF3841 domain-containing protein n=1 Tax=Paenibacillus radicis (ex Xue et al. 2023) TaxID=2972489 RepID=A0ABT1Y9M0_9BACL|nr:DUF3841 domain-containing protein [Paenibacillus radicis (ex Xue et al. 2023)]MCR8629884.1 DUF3841 domain-containing protein [Paenibacillus radicis (ex Xue et al. 2023)]